ncbi:MAG: hypothetical protein NT169_18305 [Chloroflexi bacterium]|nr:hypothetical protein [Chloroflexota bacterium]
MWPLLTQVNLIRYLIVWRVNGSQIQLPRCLPADFSQVLGALIAERLPTQQAKPWRKAVAEWGKVTDESAAAEARDASPLPEAPLHTVNFPAAADQRWPAWPIESVIWPYPGKRTYGQGEPLLWELKLLGAAADHGLFLEVILPAMEVAATTSDERWRRSRTLWGRFDIQAIYAARGPRWEPFVTDGRLDLAYRPMPTQWAEGLAFEVNARRRFHRLSWLTPFDFGFGIWDFGMDGGADNPQSAIRNPQSKAPSLRGILDALMARIAPLAVDKWATAEQAWGTLDAEEQMGVWLDCEEGRLKRAMLERASRDWPGRWIGAQLFAKMPPRLLPYLELASVLHVGQHTHFGCGTFALE